ncbi:MAG TPA: hypothetical protein VGN34_30315 [Ktedonobacteraceae bacterium]
MQRRHDGLSRSLNSAQQYLIHSNGEMAQYTCEQAIDGLLEVVLEAETTLNGLMDELNRRRGAAAGKSITTR